MIVCRIDNKPEVKHSVLMLGNKEISKQ